jgi:hypothetical protein
LFEYSALADSVPADFGLILFDSAV